MLTRALKSQLLFFPSIATQSDEIPESKERTDVRGVEGVDPVVLERLMTGGSEGAEEQ